MTTTQPVLDHPAAAVIREALARNPPVGDTAEARLDAQTAAIITALDAAHMLHEHAEPTPQWCAQQIADQSRHPRYVDIVDGWEAVLNNPSDLLVAYARAVAQPAADKDFLRGALTVVERYQRAQQGVTSP